MAFPAAPSLDRARFPWGFAVDMGGRLAVPDDWSDMTPDGRLSIRFDADQPVAHRARDARWVFLLGPVIDTDRPGVSEADLAEAALGALESSELGLWRLLDTWNGRFVLFYDGGSGPRLLHDAIGLRSVFWTAEPGIAAASHVEILRRSFAPPRRNDVIGLLEDPRYKKDVRHLPADLTPWSGIRHLMPNHAIGLDDAKLRRVFPTRPRGEIDVETASERAARILEIEARELARRFPLAIGLSAGWDSRVTLAATRSEAPRSLYFTYGRSGVESLEIDLAVARVLRDRFELPHLELGTTEATTAEHHARVAAMKANTFLSHARGLVLTYAEKLPPGRVHLRSNALEIARSFYRHRHGERTGPFTAATAAHYYKKMADRPDVVEAFETWLDEQDLTERALLGHDAADFFYWEHRMGAWHTHVVLESDVAHPSLTLFAHRGLLETLLSVPAEDRFRYAAIRGVIERLWPELLEVPVNRRPDGSRASGLG